MGDQDAKRDIFNFRGKVKEVTVYNHSSPVRPNADSDLLEAVRQLVESRLKAQLHHHVKLNLSKETQPEQVRRPWGMEVKVTIAQPSQLLPPETTIAQVFDQCSGRLLILGEPGAGKTTSLLDLALELVARAEADPQQRIPVVVDLSDWQPTAPQATSRWGRVASRRAGFSQKNHRDDRPEQGPVWSIADWLAAKLQEKYGCNSQQIGQWLAEKQLVPLLDGLDEVRPEYQQECVKAINEWLNFSDLRPRQVALCCRREQYEAYPEKLKLEGAVYLQDLTDEQIQTFLQKANRSELSESLVGDANLLALIRRPLLLSMAVLAYGYGEIDPIEWRRATSANARLNLLLDAYVQRMLMQDTDSRFYRKGKLPSLEQRRKWLNNLAKELEQHSQTEFLIEKMQATWLVTRYQHWEYLSIVVLINGLISGLVGAFISGLVGGLIFAVFFGLIVGICTTEDQILPPVEIIQVLMLSEARHRFLKELYKSLMSEVVGHSIGELLIDWLQKMVPVLALGLLGTVIGGVIGGVIGTLILGVFLGMSCGLVVGLFLMFLYLPLGSVYREIEIRVLANQGIWYSMQNAGFFILLCIPGWVLARDWLWHFSKQSLIIPGALVGGAGSALLFISLFGGVAVCSKHLVLRLVLFLNRSGPWNYARFLNYATERLLLQRVGGRYRFIHDLLRQFFVQQWIDSQPTLTTPDALARQGKIYQKMKRYDEAIESFNRAIELNPKLNSSNLSSALYDRGDIYVEMENYEEALKDFDRVVALKPKSSFYLSQRGKIYHKMKRYEEALKDYDRALKLDPKDTFRIGDYKQALCDRAEAYSEMERYEDALKYLNRAIEIDPKDPYTFNKRAKLYWKIQLQSDSPSDFVFGTLAMQDFRHATELDPGSSWVGRFFAKMGSYETALEDLNRALQVDPNNSWTLYERGDTYHKMERYEEALEDFESAIKLKPRDSFFIYMREQTIADRGVCYRKMKRYEEALQDFNCLIELDPKNTWAIANRAFTYVSMKQYEKALKDFNHAIQLDPEDSWSIQRRGEVYRVVGQYEESLKDFNHAIYLDSEDSWSIQKRGEVYQAMGQYEEALKNFNHAIQLDPEDSSHFDARGSLYCDMERYEEALQDFDRAIQLDPENSFAIANRIVIYRDMGREEEALQDLDRAIMLASPYLLTSLLLMRGEILHDMSRYEEALKDFDHVIDLDPQSDIAIATIADRGRVYRVMKQYDKALEDFSNLIERDPKNSEALAARGETYRLMERYEKALQDFDRAIELEPKYDFAIARRGRLYRAMKQYDRALGDFSNLIERDPKNSKAFATNRGETYRLMERYEEALKDFDRAIEIDPKYDWAIANRGLTYRLMERYEKALQDFDRAIELNPKDTWNIANRGLTYRLMERYKEALQDFNLAIEIDPKFYSAILYRGEVYLMLGRYDRALKDLDRAIEFDSKDDWYQYLRAITYLARNQSNPAKNDLDTAIHLAQQKHTEKPANCQNTFNLALYHLVAGNLPSAKRFYQIALQHNASPANIRDALQDLEDLLKVLGDVPDAKQMIDFLMQNK